MSFRGVSLHNTIAPFMRERPLSVVCKEILYYLDLNAHQERQASNSPKKNMLKSVNIKVGEFIDLFKCNRTIN